MRAALTVQVQNVSRIAAVPGEDKIAGWIRHAFEVVRPDEQASFDMTVRIVDRDESRALNKRFRQVDKPTNVLAFPSGDSAFAALRDDACSLGDLVICGPIVLKEAEEQHKTADAHWFHMLVHGSLHLLGYDHEDERDAAEMEALEIRILAAGGVGDPYRDR
jgi:probable rRNA maturation factor